jgi:hypothetical protein
MPIDTYATRRKERPGIRRLGQSPEAMRRKMKPAGTMQDFPKRMKVRNRLSVLSAAQRKATEYTTTKAIAKKILGRVVPVLGIAAELPVLVEAGIEGVKALKARKELRDLETATKKSMTRSKKRVGF